MAHNGDPVPIWKAGLGSWCPACGHGRIFQGYLTVRPTCDQCDLDYAAVDTGDGPAVFIILIVGFLIVGAALVVEVTYQPPYWLHLAVWLPLTLSASLGLLRPLKATMIALAYRHKIL